MPHYKIADIVCKFTPAYEETAAWYESYRTDEPLDFHKEIIVSEERIKYLTEKGEGITPAMAENIHLCTLFNAMLVKFKGSYIHSSALKFDDKVYLFSANSGVGKSSHTRRWCRLYPDRAQVINDDKPSFRLVDGKCIVYGTPFAGGTDIQVNTSGELGAIVFIERSDKNYLETLNTSSAIKLLLEQTPHSANAIMGDKLLALYSELLTKYPVYKLYCTDSDEAVSVAMNIIN